jgi:DNA polymerase-4
MSDARSILHVDMDAFFASVEQLDHPELRGRPVLVGGSGPRGVVTAASYEARPYGCRSAQPMAVARRLCPHAVIMPVRGARYRELSARVFAILESVTPLVEPLSIDEAFLDVTGSQRLLGPAPQIAARVKARIRAGTGLTASIGVAPNKFVAKLASDLGKPDGLTVFAPEDLPARLAPLPIGKMWGVGPVTESRLLRLALRTFGDLQRLGAENARRILGDSGEHFRRLALGEDDRPVAPDGQAKSLGSERTFGADLAAPDAVRDVLLGQVEHVARRLRRHGLCGRTVTLKIRFGDYETITRSATLARATDSTDELWAQARETFDRWARDRFSPVRLIGVSIGNIERAGAGQLELFTAAEEVRRRRLDQTTDAIAEKFGREAIRRGICGPESGARSIGE